MRPNLKRGVAVGAMTAVLALMAIVAGLTTSSRDVQAQPNPSIFAQQAPVACVCAQPTSVFGGGGPQIAHCQCGALSCAAATTAGGVALHCAR
jgi:tellurite resistance protein TehA-like permease